MKIKTKRATWEEIQAKPPLVHLKPKKPWFLMQALVRALSIPDLMATHFTYTKTRMEEAGDGPYLVLMNHSSFFDLKMASRILFPRKYNIVTTTDAFVGKAWLMQRIGCIPTPKFVTDVALVMDLMRIIKKEKRSVLMYPEAGYSLDGTATVLPRRLGGLCKRLGVPVLMIRSDEGGYLRDPLYNGLRLRKVKATADLSCLLTREEVKEKSVAELDEILDRAFTFDHFQAQREKKIPVTEPFRAAELERVLYRCPACESEGEMKGEGIFITCRHCGKTYELDEYGVLHATKGETEFSQIPQWFRWQRDCMRRELEAPNYAWEIPVDIGILCDLKALYQMGEGTLRHDRSGFTLRDANGKVVHTQDAQISYSLNVDYYFYELGDIIGLGTKDRFYYCFPKNSFPVAKARLAAEELYKLPKVEMAMKNE